MTYMLYALMLGALCGTARSLIFWAVGAILLLGMVTLGVAQIPDLTPDSFIHTGLVQAALVILSFNASLAGTLIFTHISLEYRR